MLNKFVVLLGGLLSMLSAMAFIGEKRTILTSGDKVHTIHYQLGQSTVLYFGLKPETVICGNKNYFHIDKIKEGLTIQPVSNISTNLTVLSQGKRFLFYLTPTKSGTPDTFIDVRWIPDQEAKLATIGQAKQVVREMSGGLRLGALDLKLRQEIIINDGKRSILEFEIVNSSRELIKTSDLEILVIKTNGPLLHQMSVFERDEFKPNSKISGRLIVTNETLKGASIMVKYQGKSSKVQGSFY